NAEIAAAGGMESMSNAPYLLDKARQGYRVGHGKILDHMFLDGLEDAYGKDSRGKLMGAFAEDTAKHYQFTRADQDAFALLSVERAKKAIAEGCFKEEITALETADRKGKKIIVQDESPGKIDPAKIPTLKPAFAPDGTITAASSSSISDGAAALILMTESRAKKLNLKPLARIIAAATESREPKWFTTAPIGAIEKILTKANWKKDQVDLFEINEAFAVVTMAAMKELNLTSGKVNIHGGACALGHPIGASGARIVVTLIHALRRHALKKGIAALCIGGGEATALAVEII
ncbi:MAG: acetyl-CoA C-acyltransferase, partial [Dongiaceae bacterium]